MKCNKELKFEVLDCGVIEIRGKKGEFHSSVCCKECIPELEKAIKKLKKLKVKE